VIERIEPLVRRRLLRAFLDDLGREAARAALGAVAELRRADPNTGAAERTAIDRLLAAEAIG
jgi:hypothetical protein